MAEEGQPEVVEEPTPEAQPEAEPKAEAKEEVAEEPKEETPEAEPKPREQRYFSQEEVGKLASSIRKSGQSKVAALENQITDLKAQMSRFARGEETTEDLEDTPQAPDQSQLQALFVQRDIASAKEEFGMQYWDDCYQIVLGEAQHDPSLETRVMGAANVGKAVIREAQRIIDQRKYGETWEERKQRLMEEGAKKWQEDNKARLATLKNQPTDVQNVRAAGGEEKAPKERSTWTTGATKLGK